MIDIEVMLAAVGMAIVTFIPRALPAVLVGRMDFGPRLRKFLAMIPYTAMTALVVPGIVKVDPSRPYIGIMAGTVAAFLAWRKLPVTACVIGAIATAALLLWAG